MVFYFYDPQNGKKTVTVVRGDPKLFTLKYFLKRKRKMKY